MLYQVTLIITPDDVHLPRRREFAQFHSESGDPESLISQALHALDLDANVILRQHYTALVNSLKGQEPPRIQWQWLGEKNSYHLELEEVTDQTQVAVEVTMQLLVAYDTDRISQTQGTILDVFQQHMARALNTIAARTPWMKGIEVRQLKLR